MVQNKAGNKQHWGQWHREAAHSYKGGACWELLFGEKEGQWSLMLGSVFWEAAYDLPSGSYWERKHQLKGTRSFPHNLALGGRLWLEKDPIPHCVCCSDLSLFCSPACQIFSLNTQAAAMWVEVMPLALALYFLCLQPFKQVPLNHLM